MVSVKGIAAIAVTLVIAIPIGMGYLFAVDETETEEWRTTERASVSDLLLNSETEYYSSYTGPMNNSYLLYLSDGDLSMRSPEYVTVSKTYSSIPLTEPEYTTISIQRTTDTVDLNEESGHREIGPASTDYRVPVADFYHIDIDSDYQASDWTLYTDGQTIHPRTVDILRSSADTWKVFSAGVAVETGTWRLTPANDRVDGTVQITLGDYVPIPDVTFSTYPTKSTWKLTHLNGDVEYVVPEYSGASVVRVGNTVTVDGTAYNNIRAVEVATIDSRLSYSRPAYTEWYADASDGWTTGVTEPGTRAWWTNGMTVGAVVFTVSVTEGETLTFQAEETADNRGTAHTLTRTNGRLYVDGTSLGDYPATRVTVSTESVEFSGLSVWPTMGGGKTYNSVSFQESLRSISRVEIDGRTSVVRVDSSEILAGSFASTKDLDLDLSQYYPSRSYVLTLNSVGVYGETLSILGTDYPVESGRITIDGRQYTVRGLQIGTRYADGSYDVTVNGHGIGQSGTVVIGFGGEWSLTGTMELQELQTVKSLSWTAGTFGFDKETLGAAGLLCCLGLFVTLGLTGARKGSKIGLLALVLGGAGFVYLIIL